MNFKDCYLIYWTKLTNMGWGIFNKYFFRNTYTIYTDGSVYRGLGIWAYIVVVKSKIVHEASGWVSFKNTLSCNNRMEFQAALEALAWLPPNSHGTLYSDSRNLIDTINLWSPRWKEQAWVKAKQRPIPNVDQIKVLYELNQRHKLEWKWVRAHSGNVYNERCDELCRQHF